ncbi:MAG TPA: hypothetical protein VGE01_12260 [Fimbriimonas sp.]
MHPIRNVIDGVPRLVWGQSGENTFAGALAAATLPTRHRVTYRTILGVTGLAFQVRWYEGGESRWAPRDRFRAYDRELEAARRATGWALDVEFDPNDRLSSSMARIRPSIDMGIPVLTLDPSHHTAVVFGYDEGRVVMREYANPESSVERDPAELPRYAVFVGRRHRPLSTSEGALEGLRIAIRQWQGAGEVPECKLGRAAYAQWAEDLRGAEGLDALLRRELFTVNWLQFSLLADARSHAGPFLREVAPFFPKPIVKRLFQAAEIYDEVEASLTACMRRKDAFFGTWSEKGYDDWTEEVRRSEAAVLHDAWAKEEEAIQVLGGLIDSIAPRQAA